LVIATPEPIISKTTKVAERLFGRKEGGMSVKKKISGETRESRRTRARDSGSAERVKAIGN